MGGEGRRGGEEGKMSGDGGGDERHVSGILDEGGEGLDEGQRARVSKNMRIFTHMSTSCFRSHG